MNKERREKAIAWLKEEIRSLERAPELNGCPMTPEWAAQLEIMRTCLEAVQDHFRAVTKMMLKTWEPCDQCKSCESCYKLYSFHCLECKEMSEFVPDSSFCGKCGRPRTLGSWAEMEKRLTDAGVLVPCPFCGAKNPSVYQHTFSELPDCFGIKCYGCGAQSYQFFDTEEEARLAWNTRAPILSAAEMEILEGME